MNDFENKIKGVLKKEVEKPLSYDYAIKNAFYNSKNKRKSNLLLKLATTTSCLIMICTGVFATSKSRRRKFKCRKGNIKRRKRKLYIRRRCYKNSK